MEVSIWNACALFEREDCDKSDADEVFAMFLEQPEEEQLPVIRKIIDTNKYTYMYNAWKLLDQMVTKTSNVLRLGDFLKDFGDKGNDIQSLRQMKANAFGKLVILSIDSEKCQKNTTDEFIQYFERFEKTINNGIFEILLWTQTMMLIDDPQFSSKICEYDKRNLCYTSVTRVLEIFNRLEELKNVELLESFLKFAEISSQTLILKEENRSIHCILTTICNCFNKYDIYIERMADLFLEFVNAHSEKYDNFLHTSQICTMIRDCSWNMVGNFGNSKRADYGLQIISAYSDRVMQKEKQNTHLSHIAHIWINGFVIFSTPNKRLFLPIIKNLRCLVEATGIGHDKLFDVLKFVFIEKSFEAEENTSNAPDFWKQTCLAMKFLLKTHFSYFIIQDCFQPCIQFLKIFPESSSILKNIFETLTHLESDNLEISLELEELSRGLSKYIDQFDEHDNPCFNDVIEMKIYVSTAADKFIDRRSTAKASDVILFLRTLEKWQYCNEKVFNTSIKFILDSISRNRDLMSSCLIKGSIVDNIKIVIPKLSFSKRTPLFDILLKLKEKSQCIFMALDFVFEFNMVVSPESMDLHIETELGFNSDQPTDCQLHRRYGYRVCLDIIKHIAKINRPKYNPILECFKDLVDVQIMISQQWRTSNCMKQIENNNSTDKSENAQVEHVSVSDAETYFEKIGELATQIKELQASHRVNL